MMKDNSLDYDDYDYPAEVRVLPRAVRAQPAALPLAGLRAAMRTRRGIRLFDAAEVDRFTKVRKAATAQHRSNAPW
jgi:hypothetical protein